jgi:hypothetical protein
MCDHYEIKDSWNVTITMADDVEGLPPRVAPELGHVCDACRRGAPGSLRPLAKLARVEACAECRICYARPDALVALDRVTSTFVRALAHERAPHAAVLSSLAACGGFDAARVRDALAPETPLAPMVEWLAMDLAAERAVSWPLLVAVVRAGAEGSALVPHLARALERDVAVAHATDALDALAAHGVDVSAAHAGAKRALERDADLFATRPHLARACS